MILDRIIQGDVRDKLKDLPTESVQTVVTSPPYWGLRDYGMPGQLGAEREVGDYIKALVAVFHDVRRILRKDGTLWLNLGDCFNAYNGNRATGSGYAGGVELEQQRQRLPTGYGLSVPWLKPKDLVGVPWRVAFALQADGWFLRSDIIWDKPNPMPESVTDRPTKSHEYIFLLTKEDRYFYDADAIKEKGVIAAGVRAAKGSKVRSELKDVNGRPPEYWEYNGQRNKRSVWRVNTKPFADAHFATFPEELIEPCIMAGARVGDTVLDPFMGAGTTGLVAARLRRHFLGIELNPEYVKIAERRIAPELRQAKLAL